MQISLNHQNILADMVPLGGPLLDLLQLDLLQLVPLLLLKQGLDHRIHILLLSQNSLSLFMSLPSLNLLLLQL